MPGPDSDRGKNSHDGPSRARPTVSWRSKAWAERATGGGQESCAKEVAFEVRPRGRQNKEGAQTVQQSELLMQRTHGGWKRHGRLRDERNLVWLERTVWGEGNGQCWSSRSQGAGA